MKHLVIILLLLLTGCGVTLPEYKLTGHKEIKEVKGDNSTAIIQNLKGDTLTGFYIEVAGVRSTTSKSNGYIIYDTSNMIDNVSYIYDIYNVTSANVFDSQSVTYNRGETILINLDYNSI